MLLRALVALQLVAIAGFGAHAVASSDLFGPIDEAAHLSYVEYMAEERRPPLLEEARSPEITAIETGTWPQLSNADPRVGGLAGFSYEAFQPPLYYLIAAPVFALPADFKAKAYAVRTLGLCLLLAAAGLLWLLAREVFGQRALPAFSLALNALLLPGVVVRSVEVSNAALEIFMALAVLLLLLRAHRSGSGHWLVAAGACLGLALLTKLTLIWLAPLLALCLVLHIRRSPGRTSVATGLLSVAAAVLVIAPWLALNEHRYGTLTANAQAREMQFSTVNPTGHDYAPGELPRKMLDLLAVVKAQEWQPPFGLSEGGLVPGLWRAVLWLGVLATLLLAPRRLGVPVTALLAGPLLLAALELSVTTLSEDVDVMRPRYLYPTLAPFGLAAAGAAAVLVRSETARRALLVTAPALLVAAWVSFVVQHG